MSIFNKFIEEPYRLFFPLGYFMGLLGTSYWLLVSTHLLTEFNPLYHGIIQIELFGASFAVGFLLTALPKFFRTSGPTQAEVLGLLIAFLLLAIAAISNSLIAAQYFFILEISLLIRFASRRAQERKAMPPYSFFLVGFGFLSGFLGALLIIFPQSNFPFLGNKFLEQGMLLSMSLGVGSFLVPRLMGVVDTHNAMISLPQRTPSDLPWLKSPKNIVLLIGVLIFISFPVEVGFDRNFGFAIRGIASTYCLWHFGILKLPRSETIIGVLVAFAMWMMVLGEILAGLFPSHEIGMLHVTYIGGFGLLILSIGAQVTSSHGGIPRFWANHKIGALTVFGLIIGAMILRALATVFSSHYLMILGFSSALFDVALLSWGIVVIVLVLDKPAH